ncbi:MAG: TonB-dependent receptor [Bacteroidetes bacterium]|nr:TonB-dependent receptor [Bacteroidota bacterium]
MDYTHPFLHQKWKAEIGVKASSMKADNELEYYDVSNNQQPLYDTFLSNHFIYQENIQAAYLTMSGKIDKLELQFGLRMENSDIDGIQLVDQVGFEKNYTNFFPSIFMNYPIIKNYNLGLNLVAE